MAYRPKIGITMRLDGETGRFYLARYYSEAVAAAGGTPIHIPLIPDLEFLEDIAGCIDGLLLPGSDSDIDPERYGEHPHPKLGAIVPEREETDLKLLEQAEKMAMPVLGICFGMQSLNISRGGSLLQDIEAQINDAIRHQQGYPRDQHTHRINIESGSFLEKALDVSGAESKVNSHHHQAIARIGKDLKITARAPDGVIEAVEDLREGRFAIGVQWHPELNWEKDALSREIFEAFVGSARRRHDLAAVS